MTIKHTARFLTIPLLLALCWDRLFWGYEPGISYFIFVVLCLLAGAALSYFEGVEPANASLALVLPALLFAGVVFLRAEPFTRFLGLLFSLGGLALLAITWRGGRWMSYNLGDYLLGFLQLAFSAAAGMFHIKIGAPNTSGAPSTSGHPANPLPLAQGEAAGGETGDTSPAAAAAPAPPSAFGWRQGLALLRGLLLALPVVLVLAALLSEADPVFSRALEGVWKVLRFENLKEVFVHLPFICIGAYLLTGVFYHALSASGDERVTARDRPGLPPFLGWIEAGTVLFLVDALFAFFTVVQFRYFFGGRANIHIQGFTYAEYARRGFGELALTAALSLLLLVCLATITRRDQPAPRRLFTALSLLLVGLVTVMLVSAFQRLLLYESAYGFTRIRAYTHIFLIWLGVLLLATAALECLGRMRSFALALLTVCIGFAAAIAIVDIDGLIVQRNVRRALGGEHLDTAYLASLSSDAVPSLARQFKNGDNPADIRRQLGGVLACRLAVSKTTSLPNWREYNLSEALGRATLAGLEEELKAYPTRQAMGEWYVRIDGEEMLCAAHRYMD